MSSRARIGQGVAAVRPLINAVRGVERAAVQVPVTVLDGPHVETERLREVIGTAQAAGDRGRGPLVVVLTAGEVPTGVAQSLATAKRAGRTALAVVVGSHGERAAAEREVLAHAPLEPSNVIHVVSLADADQVRRTLATVLGAEGIAVARCHPALRGDVADALIAQVSRQAGAIGAAIVVPGADLPAITLIQVRLVAQLAAVYGRPLDIRRGLEIAGVLAGAFGWRALARRAVVRVPVAAFALRGGVAYSGTRAVGEACKAYFATVGDRADAPLDGLANALNGALKQRRGK